MLTAGMVKPGQPGGGFATVTRSGLASEEAEPATWYRNPRAATVTAGTLTSPLTPMALMVGGSCTNAWPTPGSAGPRATAAAVAGTGYTGSASVPFRTIAGRHE